MSCSTVSHILHVLYIAKPHLLFVQWTVRIFWHYNHTYYHFIDAIFLWVAFKHRCLEVLTKSFLLYINLFLPEGFVPVGQTYQKCTITPSLTHVTQKRLLLDPRNRVFEELSLELLEVFLLHGGGSWPTFQTPIPSPLFTWKHCVHYTKHFELFVWTHALLCTFICYLIHTENSIVNIFWLWPFLIAVDSNFSNCRTQSLFIVSRSTLLLLSFCRLIVGFGSSIKTWVCLQTKDSHV